MSLAAIVVATFGLAIAGYAAMRTEIEERGIRALLGICDLLIFGLGVMLL